MQHPRIRYQLFSTGRRSTNYDATLMAIKEIGTNLEAYWMYAKTGQEAGPVAHAPPAMVLFFLFLFLPLTFAFVLTTAAVLCKPGCAISAADTSSV